MKPLKIIFLNLSIFLFIFSSCGKTALPVQSIRIQLPATSGPIAQRASQILAREIAERSGAKVSSQGKAGFTIELAVEPGVGTEGFTIADDGNGKVKITGNDENGLLYGVGKFLHTSQYDQHGFTPGAWRGTDVPKGTMRGIYFATHLMNFYEAASGEEIKRYMEDLSLWGINALLVVFPFGDLSGFDDPKAQIPIQRLNRMLADARSVGMKAGMLAMVNEGFASTPKEYRYANGNRFFGNNDNFVCPAKPGVTELLLKNWSGLLDEFTATGLDFVVYWPYDGGGCGCATCSPWGGKGYPRLCREYTTVLRKKIPDAKIIVSTWMFDVEQKDGPPWLVTFRKDGEYGMLADLLAKDKSWVDYLMIDAHEDFPEYLLKMSTPGGLSILGFPEITMFGQYPWGISGAMPLPRHFQNLWNPVKDKMMGGFPYSEGIFEDINKIIFSQFYWNPTHPAMETVKEYIAYEYAPGVVTSVSKAIDLLENNHMRKLVVEKSRKPAGSEAYTIFQGSRFEFLNHNWSPRTSEGRKQLEKTSEEALRLVKQADKQLSPEARASWRWRILYLRAVIDRELVLNDGWVEGPVLKTAYEELTRIYHSENTNYMMHVPKIEDADVKFSEKK